MATPEVSNHINNLVTALLCCSVSVPVSVVLKQWGGVAIYVRSYLMAQCSLSISIPKMCELLVIKVAISQNMHIFIAGAVGIISDYLKPFLVSEQVVLGDLNLNWLTHASDQFKNVRIEFKLAQLKMKPTRVNVKNLASSSLIDIILSNRPQRVVFLQKISATTALLLA